MISIIVPAYNVENYIKRCIKSILKQSYLDYEIIIIVDGSTDKTFDIATEMSMMDKRIRVFYKENGGLSSARNFGLRLVRGDYILYVDGDDYLSDNCLKNLIDEAKRTNADIVCFPYIKLYKKQYKRYLFDEPKVFETDEVKNTLLKKLVGPSDKELANIAELDILNTAWGKRYKSEIVSGIEFVDTQIIGPEDCWYNILVFYRCKRISYIDSCFYCYEKNNIGSLLHTYDNNYFEKRKNFYNLVLMFMSNNKLNFQKNLSNRIVLEFFSSLKKICNSDLKNYQKYLEIQKILNDSIYENAISTLEYKYLDFKGVIFWNLCKKKKARILVCIMNFMLFIWRIE